MDLPSLSDLPTKELLDRALPLLMAWGFKVVGAIGILFIALIFAGWASRAIERGLAKTSVDLTLSRFLTRLVRWLILLLAAIGCLGAFGINVTTFAAVIGAAGLAVGLAFQGTLSNFASGIMLLLFRPFGVGDFVNMGGQSGTVFGIEMFTTTLDTPDNRRLILPNSTIFGQVIENVTFNTERRADVDVGADYSADIDQTREVLVAAAEGVPGRLQTRDVQVVLVGLGGSSVDWQVRVWGLTSDYLAIRQATIRAVKIALDEAGIGIPFPQVDVHLPPRQ
ncbi:MAG: small conductance mechanosensitive channel [Hyphomicrobiaceae bacterium]|jgi:small conductance mechanosensitive channel